MKLVSIIIPVYNTEITYLKECFDSVLTQNFKDYEVIVIDDGSKIEIANYLDIIADTNSKIKIVHKKNEGVSKARNLGIEICNGKYVCFIDSDDVIEKNFLSILFNEIITSKADMAVCQLTDEKVFFNKGKCETLNRKNSYHMILNKKRFGGYICNKLFRKEMIKKVFAEDIYYCEDFLFISEYLKNVEKVSFIYDDLYFYRQNCGNATSNKNYNSKIMTLLEAYEKIISIYQEQDDKDVILLKKNILKIALNIRTRYFMSKKKSNNDLKKIMHYIKLYLFTVLTSKEIELKTKINIIITFLFPKTIFKIKNKINNNENCIR